MSRVWRTWSVLVLFALGTSLITPLIPLYQDRLGFSDTVVTLFLGCYVAALVPSMLTLGQTVGPDRPDHSTRLPVRAGRRRHRLDVGGRPALPVGAGAHPADGDPRGAAAE